MRLFGILGKWKIYFDTKRSANPGLPRERVSSNKRVENLALPKPHRCAVEIEGYSGIVVATACHLDLEPKCEEVTHSITTPLNAVF